VLVVQDEEPSQRGNIIIPSNIREKYQAAMDSGTILEMGPQAGNHFHGEQFDGPVLDVRVGDRVVYTKYAGAEMVYRGPDERYEGKECRCINDQDIYYNLTERSAGEIDRLLEQLETGETADNK
jgi:co-chaperonin GroES (HSP10)